MSNKKVKLEIFDGARSLGFIKASTWDYLVHGSFSKKDATTFELEWTTGEHNLSGMGVYRATCPDNSFKTKFGISYNDEAGWYDSVDYEYLLYFNADGGLDVYYKKYMFAGPSLTHFSGPIPLSYKSSDSSNDYLFFYKASGFTTLKVKQIPVD